MNEEQRNPVRGPRFGRLEPADMGHTGRVPDRVQRFTVSERAVHWLTALAFFSLLISGLVVLGAIPARLLADAPEPPAARFNAGQKVNFLLVSLLLATLYVSGVDTILAGTHHNLIFGGHKLATIALCVLVAGHLYMALVNRATRPALRGMLGGEVDREWARKHYPRWEP